MVCCTVDQISFQNIPPAKSGLAYIEELWRRFYFDRKGTLADSNFLYSSKTFLIPLESLVKEK
jgi:hypothetical protein